MVVLLINVFKILLNKLKVQKELFGSFRFDYFFDMRNESGSAALRMSCRKNSIAIIELLVEAGANVKSVDEEGDPAIIHLASSMLKDEIGDPYAGSLPIHLQRKITALFFLLLLLI